MELISLTDIDYDHALRAAARQYGEGVRVVFRRDYSERKLLSVKHFCEVRFYVVSKRG